MTTTTCPSHPAPLTLRERAAEAACDLHSGRGICQVGQRTTDAVLLEVADWLRDQAEATADYAARAAISGLADLIVVPGGAAVRPEGR